MDEEAALPPISRERLVDELAAVSHELWLLQGIRDYGRDPAKLPTAITDHDRERAEHSVRRLEELGIVRWAE
jgi:hypothetical protein